MRRHVAVAGILLASCGSSTDAAAPVAATQRAMVPDGGADLTDPTTTSTTMRRVKVARRQRPNDDLLDAIARCESGGDARAVSRSGRYRGAWQWDAATWRSAGGTGDPIDSSYAEQKEVARMLMARRGLSPWPACGARL